LAAARRVALRECTCISSFPCPEPSSWTIRITIRLATDPPEPSEPVDAYWLC